MAWIIRKATSNDLPHVFNLIQELAEFENLSNELTLTTEEFESDGNSHLYECLVAEVNGKVAGYALFFPFYTPLFGKRLYLEDIYVVPQLRGKGLGKALYNAVIQESVFDGQTRLRFACLEWNKKAVEFYMKSGAENVTEALGYQFYRYDKAHLIKLAETAGHEVNTTDVRVRKGLPSDASKIFALTKEFATFLRMDHSTTLKQFEEDGFGDSPWFECLVAEREGSILAYALYYDTYSTFQGKSMYLAELYVRENERQKGTGRHMLIILAKECVRRGCSRLQFLAEPIAGRFYRRFGATNLTEEQQWMYFALDRD